MKTKRLASLMLIVIMLVSMAMPLDSEAASTAVGTIDGIDYTRVNVSELSGGYPATFNCGGVAIKGKLRYSGQLPTNIIDEYIEKFMDYYDIESDDLVEANQAVLEYKYLDEVTDEQIETFLGRIGSLVGFGIQTSVLIDVGKQILNDDLELSEDAWSNTLSNFSSPLMAANTIISEIIGRVFKNNKFVKIALMIKDAIIFSFQAADETAERWEARTEGMAAIRALDQFYRMLNAYIDREAVKDKVFPDGTKWTLQINGEKNRIFSFMGVPGNVQNWRVAVNLTKEVSYSSWGGPAGGYSGPVEIELKHNMKPFSDWVFDLRVGSLKPMWYSSCESMVLDGKHIFDCSQTGDIEIYRFLCNANAKMDIYSDRVTGATMMGSSGIIQTSIFLNNFDSTQYVASTKKAKISTSTGFLTTDNIMAGYTKADAAFHVEGGYEDSMSIIMDKGYADVNMLDVIKYKDDFYTQSMATFWDDNIWAPLESKKASVTIRMK